MAVLILVRSAPKASGTTSTGALAALKSWITCTRVLLSGCWSPRLDHQVILTARVAGAAGWACWAPPQAAISGAMAAAGVRASRRRRVVWVRLVIGVLFGFLSGWLPGVDAEVAVLEREG